MSSGRGIVVIIEDAPDEAELLAASIGGESFTAVTAGTAAEGVAAYEQHDPVAVLIDWGLPDEPGVEVCRRLRAADALLPILFVSGRSDEATIARALDAGADDFITKPFRPAELNARIEAHVRKTRSAHRLAAAAGAPAAPPAPEAPGPRNVLRFGEVEVDLAAREVTVAGVPVGLGPLEFRLIEYLVRNAGVAVSREQIMSEVYGYEADISTERVDLLARRVRAKIGEGPGRGGHLVSVPGYGYRWERRRRDDTTHQ